MRPRAFPPSFREVCLWKVKMGKYSLGLGSSRTSKLMLPEVPPRRATLRWVLLTGRGTLGSLQKNQKNSLLRLGGKVDWTAKWTCPSLSSTKLAGGSWVT